MKCVRAGERTRASGWAGRASYLFLFFFSTRWKDKGIESILRFKPSTTVPAATKQKKMEEWEKEGAIFKMLLVLEKSQTRKLSV